jgi:hypothetical protein
MLPPHGPGVEVRHVQRQRNLGRVLRVGEGPDVRDPERPEEFFALGRGEPVLGVVNVVVGDDSGQGVLLRYTLRSGPVPEPIGVVPARLSEQGLPAVKTSA